MEEKQYRYPGTRPFSEKDRELFFGRNIDIRQLTELIVLEKLVVLFSKSGYGKTSLLNAGVIPQLTKEENHKVLNIRLNEQQRNPVELLIFHLKSNEIGTGWLNKKFNLADELTGDLASRFWYYAKSIQLTQAESKAITLVFDQFEELFNYTDAQVQEFSRTIATLLNLNMPDAVRIHLKQKIRTDAGYFTETETDQLLAPLNLKVVFSLRSDHLSLLNKLKTYLPAVFKKTYELQPLDEMQALEALLEPAIIKDREFASPPFSYTNATTELILNSLKDSKSQRIETFQLQLICQHAEELIIRKQAVQPPATKYELSDTELGNPGDIFEKHYKIIIDALPPADQHTARVLIEDKLIVGGNRVPLPESVITEQYHIAVSLLKILVDKRLLRSEPNTVGGTSYELSHDTLVEPITKAYRVRRQQEEVARAEAERQEEIRKLKEKQRKDRRRLMLVIAALIFALTLSGIAVWKWIDADTARNKAQTLATGTLELLKNSLPAGVTDVYAYYKQQADTAFAKGNYDKALGFYRGAKLLAKTAGLQNANETKINTAQQCIQLFAEAGNFVFELKLSNAIVVYKQILKLNPSDPKAASRIEAFSRPETLPMLRSLKLITVQSGSFIMGSNDGYRDEKPVHKVILTDYQIGTYEITNAQYAVFLNQYGKNVMYWDGVEQKLIYEYGGSVAQNNGIWQAQTGYENHPVIYITWYGAYEFCRFYGLNLPTEAQWEFAARGGNNSKGFKFAGSNDIDEVAEYSGNNDKNTKVVGGKKANELGLYDMSGNVWEWCNDWYGPYNSGEQLNPAGTENGSDRVTRGGSFFHDAYNCCVAYRFKCYPGNEYNNLGFRACFVP